MHLPASRPDEPGNLPISLSAFIGRSRETADLRHLLSDRRLLTLIGAGGSGKTRLALHVARLERHRFLDGVWLVELAPLQDVELVPQLVADALGIREQVGRSLTDLLAGILRPKVALLILDNCEHLVDAVARLAARLLSSCPDLAVLATSREPLGVPGELIWSVPPLTLPAPQPWEKPVADEERLAVYRESEAVQLFVERATAVVPSYELSARNAPVVATICHRLDGMPLAIELAAARMTTLSEEQISERLSNRFDLLTSRLKMVVPRHKTLEATLDWSYELLSQSEKTLFRRLAVFRGGWTLEAAESVCGFDSLLPEDVIDLLSGLIAKSLVVAEQPAGSGKRFRFLETILDYAGLTLGASGERPALRERHLDYYLDWAELNQPHVGGPNQQLWLTRFESNHANLRTALDWASRHDETAEKALRLASACGDFWRAATHQTEARTRLAAVLRLEPNQAPTLARARALVWSGAFAYQQSDFAAAQVAVEEALAISRRLGPEGQLVQARSLDWLGEIATEVGDYEAALPLFDESLAISRAIGYERGVANMLMQLGWAAMRVGDYDRAEALMSESVGRMRTLGEPRRLALALGGLGELNSRLGRLEEASILLEESLDGYRHIGDSWGTAATLGSLGWVAMKQRQFDRMRVYLAESIELRQTVGEVGGLAWCLEKLAESAIIQAEALPAAYRRPTLQSATQVFAAAARLRASKGSAIDPADRDGYELLLDKLRRSLGQRRFESTWSEGEQLPLPDVIELALAPVEAPHQPDELSDEEAMQMSFGGLSPRERETAALIAQGKTNREIAAIMVVREKTIETYVTRILNKLGFDSRVQIAIWAADAGLVASDPDAG